MFGTRDSFEYGVCQACGALSLESPPADPSRYYPAEYWGPERIGRLGRGIRSLRDRHVLLGGAGRVGRWIASRRPYGNTALEHWARRRQPTPAARILDVGCGDGRLVRALAAAGFRRVSGVDPYLPESSAGPTPEGARLIRGHLADIEGTYDLVMFHHSLEHMPDHHGILRAARGMVREGGVALVRMPVMGSAAWEEYREDWVQIDAPRHLLLHTREGFRTLARAAGFRLAEIVDDSEPFQFWGSELYRRGMPLSEHRDRLEDVFTPAEREAFVQRTDEVKRLGRGDQAAYFLEPVDAQPSKAARTRS